MKRFLLAVVVVVVAEITTAPAVPPCATEDSPGPCYWNAATRGNGHGRSFTVDTDGRVHYWKGK